MSLKVPFSSHPEAYSSTATKSSCGPNTCTWNPSYKLAAPTPTLTPVIWFNPPIVGLLASYTSPVVVLVSVQFTTASPVGILSSNVTVYESPVSFEGSATHTST